MQGGVAELKEALARTVEEVHSIREMCERPVMATAPQYRAPAFGHAHDVPPPPNYDAHVRPRNVNLQQALPLPGSEGITVSPDGRSLNIPLK